MGRNKGAATSTPLDQFCRISQLCMHHPARAVQYALLHEVHCLAGVDWCLQFDAVPDSRGPICYYFQGHLEIAQDLVCYGGATVDAEDLLTGMTPLHMVAVRGHSDVRDFRARHPSSWSELTSARPCPQGARVLLFAHAQRRANLTLI